MANIGGRVRIGTVLVVLTAVLMVTAQPVSAANVAIASENTNATELSNATTLDGFIVDGSGDDARLHFEGGGGYIPGATAHWSLDDNEKPAVDEINGLQASFQNSPAYVNGLVGSGALEFNDSDNDALQLTEPFDPSNNNGYTLHARVKPNEVSGEGAIFQWDGGVIIRYQAGEMRYYHKNPSNTWNKIASPAVSADTEYDVGLTWDGSTVTAYLNGSSVGSESHSSVAMGGGTDNLGLGHPNAGGGTNDFGFNGIIDEPRVWKAPLTSTEMSTLHATPAAGLEGGGTTANYVGQPHTVEGAETGKVNITTLSEATAYVEWQYDDGGTWTTLSNTSYTTTGVKETDLSTVSATDYRTKIHVSDSDGNGVVDIQGDWVTFTNQAPSIDDTTLSPEGTLAGSNPTFTAQVSDPDFGLAQGDEINASLYVDGQFKGYDTVTSNGEVSVTAQVTGESNYQWEIEDSYGGTAQSESVFIRTPAELLIFNETAPYGLINQTTVDITSTGSSGTATDLLQTSDGSVVLSGLPPDENYIFTIDAPGYFPKEMYVEDLYSQQEAYLLPESVPEISNRVTITDRTGRFGENAILIVDRVIDTDLQPAIDNNGTEWVTVGGDRIGQSGFYSVELERYGRYRFRVRNAQGDVRVLGEYTAKTGGTVDLQIGSVTYDFGDGKDSYEWDTSITNVSGGNYSATFAYNDHQNLTDSLSVVFKHRNSGEVIAQETFTQSTYGEVVYTVPINASDYENKSFMVEWNATRDGEKLEGSRVLGVGPNMNLPIDVKWVVVAFAVLVLALAFLAGSGAGPAPALVVTGLAGGFMVYIGMAPPALGYSSAIVVLMLGAIYTMRNARGV